MLQGKLRGEYWIQPADVLLWSRSVGINIADIVWGDLAEYLPAKWTALGPSRPATDTGWASSLPAVDWPTALARVREKLLAEPALLRFASDGVVSSILAGILIELGVPHHRLRLDERFVGHPILIASLGASVSALASPTVLSCEGNASVWPAALRSLHELLLSLRDAVADERLCLLAAGPGLIDQLTIWSPPAAKLRAGDSVQVPTEHLQRLDVSIVDEPLRMNVVAAEHGHIASLILVHV